MYAIDVIPLSRSAPAGTLTYRSRSELAAGTLVEVLLRRTRIRALVVSCVSVREIKSALKRSAFTLSSSEPLSVGTFSVPIMRAAESVAHFHASSVGPVLHALLGEMLENSIDVPLSVGPGFVEQIKELPQMERFAAYRAIAIEEAARGRATLLILPTLPEFDHAKRYFKDMKPLALSGSMTPKRRALLVEQAVTHTGLILATSSLTYIPVTSLGHIILERVSAGSYVQMRRPYIDMRVAALALAHERSVPITLGDFPLPLEYRPIPEAILTHTPGDVTVMDVRRKKEEELADPRPFSVLPPEAREKIAEALAQDGRILVLAARKGYASSVVCRNCGSAVRDERGVSLTLTQAKGVQVFRSVDGQTSVETRTKAFCDVCGGWNLIPLGIGVERVEEEAHEAFPDAHVVRLSREQETTSAKMRAALLDASLPGTILIGTEFLLPWIAPEERFALGIIASADSLLSVPFWRARERFVRIAYMLAERSWETLVLTRRADDTAVDALAHPETATFFKEETMLRKAVGYPPYGSLIVLSVEGASDRVAKTIATLSEQFASYNPRIIAPRPSGARLVRASIVLTRTHDAWPDAALSEQLSYLSPEVKISINPESF